MKSIFITGAGRGLGCHIAEYYISKGWQVFGGSRNNTFSKTLIKSPNFKGFSLDITDYSQCEAVLNEAISLSGSLDVLINNASGNLWGSLLGDYENEDIIEEVTTTLIGPIMMSNEFVRQNKKSISPDKGAPSESTIVNISSIAGHLGEPGGGHSVIYSSAKSALQRFTECANDGFKGRGFKFYTIVPDNIRINNFVEEKAISYDDVCTTLDFILSSNDNLLVESLVLRPLKTPEH